MKQLQNHRCEKVLSGLWHDYANLFPMLAADAQDGLRADILVNGVNDPVIVFDGRILDGRNRYMAARDLGMDFPVADFVGTDADALAYVLSTNLHRRHLTESQRAAVAAKLSNMRPGNPDFSKPANLPDREAPVSQAQAAEMLNVSERSVRAAKSVLEHGAPETISAVESGAVSVSAATAVSHMSHEEQAAAVAEGPKAVVAKAKEIRGAKAAAQPKPPADEPTPDPHGYAKLTEAALLETANGLRADLDEEKAKRKAAQAECKAIKQRLADHTSDDKDEVIRRLQAEVKYAGNAKWKAQEDVAAHLRQIYALKKRVEELEQMGVAY